MLHMLHKSDRGMPAYMPNVPYFLLLLTMLCKSPGIRIIVVVDLL